MNAGIYGEVVYNGYVPPVVVVFPTSTVFYVYGWASSVSPRTLGNIAWAIRQMTIPGSV